LKNHEKLKLTRGGKRGFLPLSIRAEDIPHIRINIPCSQHEEDKYKLSSAINNFKDVSPESCTLLNKKR
jgi:hypothetical protein